jgi:Ca-activated chloride channel family protein
MGFFQKILVTLLLVAMVVGAKTALQFFNDAAFLYSDARLPSAAIEARTGIAQYPNDIKLQRLLKRIEEAQKEQQKQNDKDNPGKQDEKQDEDQKSSSSGKGQGQSASSQAQSSSSGNGEQKPEDQTPSSQSGASSSSDEPLQEGQLNKDQAEQMLKDFQENDKERKRKIQMRGRAAPEKDW